jgi:transmembrane sensor
MPSMFDDELSAISLRAATWFIRVKDRDMSHRDRCSYARWLKGSPKNVAEMLRIAQISGRLRVGELQFATQPEGSSAQVVPLFPQEQVGPSGRPGWSVLQRGAATFFAITVAVVLVFMTKITWIDRVIQTRPGEWRTAPLADGSTVRLGPNSRLRLAYEKRLRRIELLRGEALFQVAPDSSRPFLVDAESAVVRAAGTQFGVSKLSEKITVTVVEGSVAVSRRAIPTHRTYERRKGAKVAATPAAESLTVTAGQQLVVTGIWPVAARQVNVFNELAWAEGRLMFESASVASVVSELNRRNRLQIELVDAEVASREIYGTFQAADPETFAGFLQSVAPVAVVRVQGDVLRIEPRSARMPTSATRTRSEDE